MYNPLENLKDFVLTCNEFDINLFLINSLINVSIYLLIVAALFSFFWLISRRLKIPIKRHLAMYFLISFITFELVGILLTYYFGVTAFPLIKLIRPLDCFGYSGFPG